VETKYASKTLRFYPFFHKNASAEAVFHDVGVDTEEGEKWLHICDDVGVAVGEK